VADTVDISKDFLWYWCRMTLFIVVGLVSVILSLYSYFSTQMDYPSEWGDKFQTQCGVAPKDYNLVTLSQSANGFLAFGAYLGMLLKASYNLDNASLVTYQPTAVFEDTANPDWSFKTLWNTLIRLVFAVVCCVVVYLPVLTLQNFFANNEFLTYLVKDVLSRGLIGVAMFGFTDIVMEGWGRIIKKAANPLGDGEKLMELSDYKVVIL
jgi:hypothetical protein